MEAITKDSCILVINGLFLGDLYPPNTRRSPRHRVH
jgi:hypothetical protein